MKKFPRYIIFGLLFFLFASFSNLHAVKKLEYYTDLFEAWGFTVFSQNDLNNASDEDSVHIVSDENKVLLMFSAELSQLPPDYIYTKNDFVKLVILCDGENFSTDFFSCTNSQVNLQDGNKQFLAHKDEINTDIYINYFQHAGKQVFVIAENDLAIPDVRNVYKSYFTSISSASDTVHKDNLRSTSIFKQSLVNFISSSFFIQTKQVLFVALFLILLKSFLLDIYNSPREVLNYQYYVLKLNNFQKALEPKKVIFSLLFIAASGFYFTLLSFISLRQIGIIDKNHIVNLVNSSMKTSYVQTAISGGNIIIPTLYVINVLLIILLLTIVLPGIVEVIIFSLRSAFAKKKKKETNRGLVLLLINLSIFLLMVFELSQVYIILTGLLLLTVYEIYIGEDYIFEVSQFAKSVKSLFVSTVIILLGFTISFKLSTSPKELKYENLLPSEFKIITLPYSKQNRENSIFNDFYTSATGPIFTDNVLIYHPNYESLVTKPMSTYKDEGSYAILRPNKRSDYVELINHSETGAKLLSYVPTPVFKFTNLSEGGSEDYYKINLSIDCASNSSDFDVKLFVNSQQGSIDETFFSFPGCLNNQQMAYYEIPLRSKYNSVLSGQDALVELTSKNVDKKLYVSNLTVSKNSSILPIVFIKEFSDNRVLYSQEISTDKKFVVYSADVNDEFSFINNLIGQVNIAKNVNYLNDRDALSNPFIIWSPDNNLIVKNSF